MTPEARRQIEATIAFLQSQLDADCDCPEASPITVQELWDRYLESLPDERWKLSVVSTMKKLIARLGPTRATSVKIAQVQDYRDDPEIRAHYSVTSINIQTARLKTCFNWALLSGRIHVNPLLGLKRLRGKPKRETEISAEGEAATLARMEPWMQAFFLVAIDAAMRRGEIRLLEWNDIDFQARRLNIPAHRTKTKRARIGRLTTRAVDALQKLPRFPGCPWVFVNPKTFKPWSEVSVWLRWRAAADGAGLKPAPGDGSVRLHDARGTAASRLVRLGASMPAVQHIMGHASLLTTAGYVRVQSKDVDAAHELLEAHVSPRKGPQRAKPKQMDAALKTA